ncbi:hypothetical protein [Methylobacterium thuringiense]|uniref:Alpha/beta hydrolase n=1 Tax=Methylobacterium thuringiense TaxID=1003091 RepID=A0ABQ4TT45_9HYPH|nr:hypothetical protein [Methylobacterium thuringiense]GJE57322.1 hypothetical protein EKPJFOCH_3836 [Methylobacterium thuringiense]
MTFSNISNNILLEVDKFRVEFFFNSIEKHERIAFVFSNHGNTSLDGMPDGGSTLYGAGYDVICFKTTANDWYQTLPFEIFDKISQLIYERSYQRVVGYGFSMGGFAAAVFSKLLSCDTVLLLSPQYSVRDSFDTRWHYAVPHVNWRYELTDESISKTTKFLIFYDNKDIDKFQIEKFIKLIPSDNLTLKSVPYCDHTSIAYLKEIGILRDVLLKSLDTGRFPELSYQSGRRNSRTYLHTLSLHLYIKNKLKWALGVNDIVLRIEPGNIANYQTRCMILEKALAQSQTSHHAEKRNLAEPENKDLKPHTDKHMPSLFLKLRAGAFVTDAYRRAKAIMTFRG